eukprot:375729_1
MKKKWKLDERSLPALQSCQEDLDSLCRHIIRGTLQGACKLLEEVMMSMHQQDFAISSKKSSQAGSLYIREFKSQIDSVVKEILPMFVATDILREAVDRMITRLVAAFMWHCSAVAPVSARGLIRLAADIAAFQEVVAGLSMSGIVSGGEERLDEAFKPLLQLKEMMFLKPEGILQWINTELVPHHIVLHHLLRQSLSLLPQVDTVRTPWALMGWSLARYSKWCSGKTDSEICKKLYEAHNEFVKIVEKLKKSKKIRRNKDELLFEYCKILN